MYKEIETIRTIPDPKTQLAITLMFVEEYGGWVTHIENTGMVWGASGEETRAGRELLKAKRHLESLNNYALNLFSGGDA